ncbi:MAG: hypothetical protein ACP5E2_11630 [Terracidiphilus sp.]
MSRKGAWLMLLVAVLWSVLPASARLLTARSMASPACCRGMESNCPMQSTGISCMCCPTHEDNAAVAPEAPAPATQPLAFLPCSTDSLISNAATSKSRPDLAVPHFDPSPGKFSIRRI